MVRIFAGLDQGLLSKKVRDIEKYLTKQYIALLQGIIEGRYDDSEKQKFMTWAQDFVRDSLRNMLDSISVMEGKNGCA